METILVDTLHPEDVAMLQALYSRSSESVRAHLSQLETKSSGDFMSKYYVNYGHKSIADCGSTTLFFEGVSILAAKAVQDWPLYSGQETSTRYINMAEQPLIDPLNRPDIHRDWMSFYTKSFQEVSAHIEAQYPIKAKESKSAYAKAVKARAFDILRGFLPCGITTQVSWSTNLRQAHDHLEGMLSHPLSEVRALADSAYATLQKRYPGSFNRGKCRARTLLPYLKGATPFKSTFNLSPDLSELLGFRHRAKWAELPYHLNDLGQVSLQGSIDYGSWRDLQRHRSGVCRVPYVGAAECHPWYMEQLPSSVRAEAELLWSKQQDQISGLPEPEAQYYQALGALVPYRVTYPIPALVYVMELRSQQTVHPTLREEILRWAPEVHKALPHLQ
jgi:thymidylate synthase ThyX